MCYVKFNKPIGISTIWMDFCYNGTNGFKDSTSPTNYIFLNKHILVLMLSHIHGYLPMIYPSKTLCSWVENVVAFTE